MILEQINKDNIQAMKDHNQNVKNILGILKNKELLLRTSAEKKAKNEAVTDVEMISIIQKTIKELEDEKESYQKVNNMDEATTIQAQIDYIKKYLPQMMSKEEIKKEILSLENMLVPTVMKHFKANFAGKCDMKEVQEVLKSLQ